MQRPWVYLVGFVAVTALLWGGGTLQRTFADERETAQAALVARERALAQYAVSALEKKLRRRLDDAASRIDSALADPLQPAEGLLFVEEGLQRLPRVIRHAPGIDTPARRLHDQLLSALPPEAEELWGERLALFGALRRALDSADSDAITDAVHSLLDHESRYVVPVDKDVVLRLSYLEALVRGTSPDRRLLEALLRDGLRGTRGRRLVGLQAMLLSNADRFSKADFEYLTSRVSSLSRRARVVHDDFDATVSRAGRVPVVVPESLTEPALVADATWYAAPVEKDSFRGVAVDLDELLEEVTRDMLEGGLMRLGGRLVLTGKPFPVATTAMLPLAVTSPEFAREAARLDDRYALKTGVTIALGLLVLGVALLSLLLYWQERRYLESKAAFVATVSHELRTPIASLRLMGETLERRLAGSEAAKDFPTRIVAEADRLAFLVENVLSFNRLERAEVATNRQQVSIDEVVEAVRPDTPAFAKGSVEISVEGGDHVVSADPELVRLLFSNLVHNACKYNDRDPVQVAIAAVDKGAELVVTVTDNGRGIPEKDHERVFTEFFRSKGGHAEKGFGLGLALCRRIMVLHGGSIRVARSDETGTTFEMTFAPGVAS